jgi:tyrosyl-tRNA synthetase
MKTNAASGREHPMALKKELARGIVADFHSAEAAAKAAEDWAKQFQKDQVPEEIEEVEIELSDVWGASIREAIEDAAAYETSLPPCRIRLDKLVARAGLADSVTDAVRKLKQNSVKVNGEAKTDPVIYLSPQESATVRVGKKIKRIRFTFNGRSFESLRKSGTL